jgi:hypothetical protein
MFEKTIRIAAPLALALAALPARADDARAPSRDESIAFCVQAKEITVQCKEELADHFAAMAPPERRANIRAKVLSEIVQESTGPLEPRRAKCATDYDRKTPVGRLTAADMEGVKACAREADCKARVACWTSRARRVPH